MALRLIGVLVLISGSTSFMPRFRLYASTILISVVLFIPYFFVFFEMHTNGTSCGHQEGLNFCLPQMSLERPNIKTYV